MGGAAMGPMSPAEKYMVVLDFEGPRTKEEAKKFNKEVNNLLKKFGGKKRKVKYQMTGFKQQQRSGGGG